MCEPDVAADWPGDMPDEFRKGVAFAEAAGNQELERLRARVAYLEAVLVVGRGDGFVLLDDAVKREVSPELRE